MAAEAGYNHCMSVSVVYETHSISVDNERGIATGWLEGALSEAGRAQARRLGERRRNECLAAVFTSDLRRAVETAEIAFSGSEIPVYRDRRLRECNYGSMNGMPAAQLEGERRRRLDEPFPGGESRRLLGRPLPITRFPTRAHDRPCGDSLGARSRRARDDAGGTGRCAIRLARGV